MIRSLLIPVFALIFAQPAPAVTIPFTEAANHIGAEVTVTGKVSGVRVIPSGMGFVNFGGRAFTAVSKPGTFEAGKLEEFMGKDVEVTGTVELYKDSPQIVLKTADSIRVSGGAPPAPGEPEKPAPAEIAITALEIELDRKEIKTAGKSDSGFKPTKAKLVIALPADFKPSPQQRVLAVFPDFSSEADLEKLITPYAQVASRKGWVVISAHIPTPDEFPTPGLYAAAMQAAIRQLSVDYPGAETWGLYLAGSSEGASRAGLSFGALIQEGYEVRGCFLNSLKREELGKSIRLFDPSKTKVKRVKVFVSHGEQDTFVTKQQSLEQTDAIRKAGLENVRHEIHGGRGWMDAAALGTALAWFEENE